MIIMCFAQQRTGRQKKKRAELDVYAQLKRKRERNNGEEKKGNLWRGLNSNKKPPIGGGKKKKTTIELTNIAGKKEKEGLLEVYAPPDAQ